MPCVTRLGGPDCVNLLERVKELAEDDLGVESVGAMPPRIQLGVLCVLTLAPPNQPRN